MTTMTADPATVTGGVDDHLDVHVAAAVDHLGGLLATASFPTTAAGYRRLRKWLRSFGPEHKVGVDGTGRYGSALARYLTEQHVTVIEVGRANRQVRRRHGKTKTEAIRCLKRYIARELYSELPRQALVRQQEHHPCLRFARAAVSATAALYAACSNRNGPKAKEGAWWTSRRSSGDTASPTGDTALARARTKS